MRCMHGSSPSFYSCFQKLSSCITENHFLLFLSFFASSLSAYPNFTYFLKLFHLAYRADSHLKPASASFLVCHSEATLLVHFSSISISVYSRPLFLADIYLAEYVRALISHRQIPLGFIGPKACVFIREGR